MLRARLAVALVVAFGASALGASCNRNNTGDAPPGTPQVRPEGQTPGSRAPAPPPSGNAVTEVRGVDLTALAATERELFWNVANDELSPCGDPHSLAVCGRDNTCNLCVRGLNFLSHRVQEGFRAEQLGDLVRARYARTAVRALHIEGAPIRGNVNAPVTLVEFTDYECPHCGHAAPEFVALEHAMGDRLRVVHMHFPLPGHPHSMPASRAAVAAMRQNHFWEMNDLLFANQQHLETADLDRYATQLQLDMTRFHADIAAPATDQFILAQRREGERLQLGGTPTVYINGREFPGAMRVEAATLREWCEEEAATPTPGTPTPPPAAGPEPAR